ncbi:MAG: N-acetyl-gamma-glutamyl-phosphate reductase [Kiritimatiellae bacterium]|jgi:N-acetyl-gamma-glutamyl-phosphate reductase|nr:N-acetyl-gamma-glutamyl-phosphate reductase [Kiritimatiellia bacterium]
MFKTKIVGATGYGGIGIIELLLQHPEFELTTLVARENVGEKISTIYPHLESFCDLPVLAADDPQANSHADVVLYATPDKVGMAMAKADLKKGAKIIDYSGDFRFTTEEAYADYATRIGKDPTHAAPELLGRNAYGLAELHRDEIKNADIVGNPGCFACSCILGMAPAVGNSLVEPLSIICDCKTGVSGAGKKVNPAFHYPARYEQMNAYKLAGHQHVCEVERELTLLSNEDVKITFTAQVVPVCRGILSTLYGTLTQKRSEAEVLELYKEFFQDSPFVRVYGSQTPMGTINVRGTNYCNLVVSVDERVNRLRIVAHIDNLMKGQAGSALQNMNLMFNLPENTGLNRPGMYP